VIVDFAGTGMTTAAAVDTVQAGGRVVQVGMARARGEIDLARLTLASIDLLGSSNGGHDDMRAVLGLMEDGRVRPLVEHIGFDGIGDALDRLAHGRAPHRLVALLDQEEDDR
jgi:alcohol dehydrogenase, propanol-preferring